MADYSQKESEAVKLLKIQLDVVNAKNKHLNEENLFFRDKINRLENEQRSTSNVNVESQMRVFTLEDERDKMYANLERLKARYNKLHTAYLETVKRCKALEEVFSRQKILPGLVKKNTLDQLKFAPVTENADQQQHKQKQDEENVSSGKIATLQRSLEEAYDIIDELEFELESVDFLEIENERLKNELNMLKKNVNPKEDLNGRNEDHQYDRTHRSSTCSSTCDECGSDGVHDLESIERSVLTPSLIDTVQTESHLMRRELLRSRMQHTRQKKVDSPGELPGERNLKTSDE